MGKQSLKHRCKHGESLSIFFAVCNIRDYCRCPWQWYFGDCVSYEENLDYHKSKTIDTEPDSEDAYPDFEASYPEIEWVASPLPEGDSGKLNFEQIMTKTVQEALDARTITKDQSEIIINTIQGVMK